jgi:hypothetical protein
MGADKDRFRVWDCGKPLRFKCLRSWGSLEETGEPGIRHCDECARDVYLCRTPAEFVAQGERGHCVAIPDGLGPTLMLGEPEPAEVLRRKEDLDRGVTWWDDVLGRHPSLGPEAMERVRGEREGLALWEHHYTTEYVAIMRLAVRDGSVPCPKCGFDFACDGWAPYFYLMNRRCELCGEAFDLDLTSSS